MPSRRLMCAEDLPDNFRRQNKDMTFQKDLLKQFCKRRPFMGLLGVGGRKTFEVSPT